MAFRLQTLLDLRVRAEQEAERVMADAVTERVKSEAAQTELQAAVTRARDTLADAQRVAADPATVVGEGLARGRYRARLAEQLKLRTDAADVHRKGPLAAAIAAEQAARDGHLEARREREALEKHKEKEEARERKITDRRSEDAASDLAIAAHFRKFR